MTTESEAKLQRYNTIEREADEWGRVIGVRRLRPSERSKVLEFTAGLSGYDELTVPSTKEKVAMSHRLPWFLAAAVCELEGSPIPFARSEGELRAIYDRLDDEGLAAAGKALVRLTTGDVSVGDPVDAAKNLSGTPLSA